MNGIVLFSGINYSGKSTILNIIKEKIYKEGFTDIKFETLSKLMMEYSNIKNHAELGEMNPVSRNLVRQNVLLEIVNKSIHRPIFLDSHFIFEDGEKSDFSVLYRYTKMIVLVKPDPESILNRAIGDNNEIFHPGRHCIRDIDFITKYIAEDEKTAIEYIESSYKLTGYKSDLIVIKNNILGLDNLREEVFSIMPRIKNCLFENNFSLEGSLRYYRL